MSSYYLNIPTITNTLNLHWWHRVWIYWYFSLLLTVSENKDFTVLIHLVYLMDFTYRVKRKLVLPLGVIVSPAPIPFVEWGLSTLLLRFVDDFLLVDPDTFDDRSNWNINSFHNHNTFERALSCIWIINTPDINLHLLHVLMNYYYASRHICH